MALTAKPRKLTHLTFALALNIAVGAGGPRPGAVRS
jgi:hypothetical protein